MSGAWGRTVVAEGLVVGYGPTSRAPNVLHGIDLEVRPGVVTAVVGPNGAGKSTLFRALLGLLPVRAGRVAVGGVEPHEHRLRHGFGYLPESVATPRGWTAGDWVRWAARLKGRSGADANAEAASRLERMGVARESETRLERLSRGTARRVALAWVLTGPPHVVLLDEPLAAMDAPARLRVRAALGRLRDRGITVLVATHELHEVPRLADRAVVLSAGRLVADLARPDPGEMEALIVEAARRRR